MSKCNIMMAHEDGEYIIEVEGRATFECSTSLKNFSDNIASGSVSKIVIDFRSCIYMDSTFMGVLAIVGLKSRKLGIVVEIHNADQKIMRLIKDIGIENLFKFVSDSSQKSYEKLERVSEFQKNDNESLAETVLKAHETLIEVNSSNAPKFEKVIELVKKEMKTETDKNQPPDPDKS